MKEDLRLRQLHPSPRRPKAKSPGHVQLKRIVKFSFQVLRNPPVIQTVQSANRPHFFGLSPRATNRDKARALRPLPLPRAAAESAASSRRIDPLLQTSPNRSKVVLDIWQRASKQLHN